MCLVCMDVVALVSSCFKRNKKVGRSVLAVLDYMFHGSCRRVSKVLKQMKSSVEKVFTWLTSKFRRLAIRWREASINLHRHHTTSMHQYT